MFLKCCYYDVSQLEDPQIFEKALSRLVWKGRAEKVNRYRFDKDKRLCLGAGLLAQYMLEQAGVTQPQFCETEFGKPALSNHTDIHFNISHDGTNAVCAIADSEVGIDIQKTTEYDRKIATHVFQSCEAEWIENSQDKDKAFTRLWTRKESYVKLIGKGLSLDLKSFSILPESKDLSICFNEFDIDEYHLTVCTEQEVKIEILQWMFKI